MGGRAPQGMPLECTAARHQRPNNAHFTPWNWQVKINSPTCNSENLPPAAAPGGRGPSQSAACLLRSLNATLGPSSNRMKKMVPHGDPALSPHLWYQLPRVSLMRGESRSDQAHPQTPERTTNAARAWCLHALLPARLREAPPDWFPCCQLTADGSHDL